MVSEMSSNTFRVPLELSFDGNLKMNWEAWKKKFEIYMTATESNNKDDKTKTCHATKVDFVIEKAKKGKRRVQIKLLRNL